MERDPQWLQNVIWMVEVQVSLYSNFNTQNSRIWATFNPREYQRQLLRSPHVTILCGFTKSFILSLFFLLRISPSVRHENLYGHWITEGAYLTLLRDHVVLELPERHALLVSLSCRMVPRLTLHAS